MPLRNDDANMKIKQTATIKKNQLLAFTTTVSVDFYN
jgi:hypothetical protein